MNFEFSKGITQPRAHLKAQLSTWILMTFLSNEFHIQVDTGARIGPTPTNILVADEIVDDFQSLRELRLLLVHLDVVLILEHISAVLLDGLEGVLAVLDLVLQRVVEGDGRDILDGELA